MAAKTILDMLHEGRDEPDLSKMKADSGGVEGHLHTNKVQDWTEFTYGNILLAFGEFLTQPVTGEFPERHLWSNTRIPKNEEATMDLGRLTLNTVLEAVNVTAREFPGHFPRSQGEIDCQKQYKISNLNHHTTGDKDKQTEHSLRSDWGFFYAPGAEISCLSESDQEEDIAGKINEPEEVLLVVGEAKKSTNWSFDDSINALERPRNTWSYKVKKRGSTSKRTPGNPTKEEARKPILRPTDQLGTYCVWSRTALGFLHTEKELVVCNTIRKQRSRGAEVKAEMQVLRTCWKPSYEEGTITPELALFCIVAAAYYRDNNFPAEHWSSKDIITWHRVPTKNEDDSENEDDTEKEDKPEDEDAKYRNKFSGLLRPYSELKVHTHLQLSTEEYHLGSRQV